MATYDFSRFVKRITINPSVSVESIYNAWTTTQGLESWFLRLAAFKDASGKDRGPTDNVQQNDSFKWLWFGYNDEIGEQNKVMLVNNKDMIQFGFTGGCIVTVTIKAENNETVCELTQQMPMDDIEKKQSYYIECGIGWTFYLANLKSIMEGGIDLRNKNATIQSVVNA